MKQKNIFIIKQKIESVNRKKKLVTTKKRREEIIKNLPTTKQLNIHIRRFSAIPAIYKKTQKTKKSITFFQQ